MMFLRRTLIASAAFAMLASAPALAVDYGRWFFSTANDPKPTPSSDCVKRAQAAMAKLFFHPFAEFVRLAHEAPSTDLLGSFAFVIHFAVISFDT